MVRKLFVPLLYNQLDTKTMTTTLKKIALNILSVLIFIAVPTMMALLAIGEKTYGQYGFYIVIGLSVTYYLLNRNNHIKS